MSYRDPVTGELTHPISIHVHLTGERVRLYSAPDWAAAARFLRSAEFRTLAGRLDFVTLMDCRPVEDRKTTRTDRGGEVRRP